MKVAHLTQENEEEITDGNREGVLQLGQRPFLSRCKDVHVKIWNNALIVLWSIILYLGDTGSPTFRSGPSNDVSAQLSGKLVELVDVTHFRNINLM